MKTLSESFGLTKTEKRKTRLALNIGVLAPKKLLHTKFVSHVKYVIMGKISGLIIKDQNLVYNTCVKLKLLKYLLNIREDTFQVPICRYRVTETC